ncbi:hypothetical protein bcgnr5369_02510 [Bacillus cereus]
MFENYLFGISENKEIKITINYIEINQKKIRINFWFLFSEKCKNMLLEVLSASDKLRIIKRGGVYEKKMEL